MRRIPRPQRSIDPTLPSSTLLLPRIPPSPYRATLITHPLRSTSVSAPFSTSTRLLFLTDKQDKKKQKAFVRRWQKRLLGDSEPIGAHVDPYDATSPVRISPEETGEEQEVLEGVRASEIGESKPLYEEAEDGRGLKRVGTLEWIRDKEEQRLMERFEKLTLKEYSDWEPFAGFERTNIEPLRKRFHQAVVEVYTLQQAGMNMDLASYPSGESYGNFNYQFRDVGLSSSPTTGLSLNYPDAEAQERLLQRIKRPDLEFVSELSVQEPPEPLEELVKEAESPPEDTKPSPVRALIKRSEGKLFDFMSNRPVPRKPTEITPAVAEVVEVTETKQAAVGLDLEAAAENRRKAVAEMPQTVFEAAAQRSENTVAALREEVRGNITARASKSITVIEPVDAVKYRDIPLTDTAIKFALAKRILKLTGQRISDPQLHSSHTLGDLYGYLIEASKPTPKKLYDEIALESKPYVKEARHLERTLESNSRRNVRTDKVERQLRKVKERPGLQQLSILQNVKMYKKKVDEEQMDKEVGRWKVIQYALAERGLPIKAKGKMLE